MAHSSGASYIPVHQLRRDGERKENKCILATCGIWKHVPRQSGKFVGTGSLIEDLFPKCDIKIHLVTSDKVISSDDLSCYSLYFKKSKDKGKEPKKLDMVSSEVIFKSGLAIVPVDPSKLGIIKKHTSGLLNHRPFTICPEVKEGLRNYELYCHVVEEAGKSFAIRPYQVKGITDEETYLTDNNSIKIESASFFSSYRKGLGAPIAITVKGEAKAVGAITLGNNEQISFVLFSQIDRTRAFSDERNGGGGEQEAPGEPSEGGEQQAPGEPAGGEEQQAPGKPAGGEEQQAPGEPSEGEEQQASGELTEGGEQQAPGKPAEGGEQQAPGELDGNRGCCVTRPNNSCEGDNSGELNIKVDVDHLKPEEQNMQTGMLATESVRRQEVQQPRASATSAAPGSVSHPQTEDLKALKEKNFQLIFHDCYHSTNPKSIEEWNWFKEYLKEMRVIITGTFEGSLVITVKCESLMILEELWKDYSSGHLGEVVQNCFVTEKILKELNLAELRLKTTMDIEEYNACKMFFEKDSLRDALSSEFHTTSSTSESPQKKEQWEKSERKTKVMETAKLEGASSSEFHSISSTSESPQNQEELKKWKQKTKIVETEKLKGASSSEFHSISSTSESPQIQVELKKWKQKTKIVETEKLKGMLPLPGSSTSDPEKELEELQMKLQRMEGASSSEFHSITSTSESPQKQELKKWKQKTKIDEKGGFPVLQFSTVDLEEKLAKLRTELQRLRREGTFLSTALLTADLEEKLKKLLKELERQRDKGTLPPTFSTIEVEVDELLMKFQGRRMAALSTDMVALSRSVPIDSKRELEELQRKLQIMEGSLHSLPTTDLKEKLKQVFEEICKLRMEGSFYALKLSTIDLGKKLAELRMKLQRLRMEGTLPHPELFTADLEDELEQLEQRKDGRSRSLFTTTNIVHELRQELEKVKMEALENAMYPTIRSGLAKFDVSLPGELQKYVSNLLNESAKLHSRKQVFQPPRALEELREAMDKDELKTFLTIHIREGAWQVVLLFTDELPRVKLPRDWCGIIHSEDEEVSNEVIYSSTSGILNVWPTEYDPDLITLCKAITNRDWKVTRLILSRRWISDEDFKNLSTALPQSELYSLTLYRIGLQSQGLKYLCEALISSDCHLTSLNVSHNRLGDEGIVLLGNALTSVNCRLTTLNVSDNRWGDEGIVYLCNALTSIDCTLTSLNVSANKFGDEGIMHMCNALTNVNCTLTSLNVSYNWLKGKGIKHLCNALTSVNCTLTSLNVSANNFGDKEIMHMCNALTNVNCTLTSLNVSYNRLEDKGIMHLCNALTSVNCRLTSLNVRENEFGDKGLKHLFDALTSSNCVLTALDICNNEFGDEGIKHLCKALTDTNCKLRSLDYHGNRNVTDEGEKYLSQMLTGTDWEVRGAQLSRSITK